MGEPSGPPDQSCCPCGPVAQTTQQQRIATGADLQWPGGITPQAMERFDELKRRVAYQGKLLGPVIQAIGGQIIADLEYHDRLLKPVINALVGPIQRRVRAQSKALQSASDMLTSAIWQRIQEQGTRLSQIQQGLLVGEYAQTPRPAESPIPEEEALGQQSLGEALAQEPEQGPAIGNQSRSLSPSLSKSGISERTEPLPELQEPTKQQYAGNCQHIDICPDGVLAYWLAYWWAYLQAWLRRNWHSLPHELRRALPHPGKTPIGASMSPAEAAAQKDEASAASQPDDTPDTPQQYDGSLRLTVTTGLPWDDPYAGDDLVEDNR